MVYTRTITSSSGGSASAPVQDRMAVTRGLIYQFELYLPPGSSGLLKVRLDDGAYPLYPSEPSEWFFGDNTLISFPDRYFVLAPDQCLVIWHYNEDDTYDHVFQVRIGQVLAEAFIASFLPGVAMESVTQSINALVEAQAAGQSERLRAARAPVEEISGIEWEGGPP